MNKSQIIEVSLQFRKIIINSNYGLPNKFLNIDDEYYSETFKLKILYKRFHKIEKIWKSGKTHNQ
jgi:hypothetical protein